VVIAAENCPLDIFHPVMVGQWVVTAKSILAAHKSSAVEKRALVNSGFTSAIARTIS